MIIKPWWEKWPGRLEYELEQLAEAGIPVEQDQEAFDRNTVLLKLRHVVDDEEIDLVAVFPDFYPSMRFEVYAPKLNLKRHQNPFVKNLCMLGRSTENWKPSDTLADFIVNRLPIVIATGNADEGTVCDNEEHQGEPFTDYYPYVDNSMILIDSSWELDPVVDEGKFTAKINVDKYSLRGAICNIKSVKDQVLISAESGIEQLYSQQIIGRWIRINEPIVEADACQMLKMIEQQKNKPLSPIWHETSIGKIDILGIVFSEEIGYRNKKDGWLFIVRRGEEVVRKSKRKKQYGLKTYCFYVRSGRAGKVDLLQRANELAELHNKKIAVVGLGCLGAPSVLELARCGIGELRILDHDIVDPGTILRWPFGMSCVGYNKTETLSAFIKNNYPYTKVLPIRHRIGAVSRLDSGVNGLKLLNDLLDGVDLLFDATAERGVQQLLSSLAAEFGIPYIAISTTEGAWGGQIVRIIPDKSKGCWMCFMKGLDEGTVPLPNANPSGEVQPIGCAEPTYTGTSFDTSVISTGGVRMLISTLLSSYPSFEWDIATINLRDKEGELITPEWITQSLEKHPSCDCNKKS